MANRLTQGVWLGVLTGAGVGVMLTALITLAFPPWAELSSTELTERARAIGMRPLSELPGKVALVATANMSMSEVGEVLVAAGAIPESEALVRRARERGQEAKVRAGVHIILSTDSPDQIIDKVTKGAK